MRDAYPEFRGGLSNSCSPDDPRPILRNQPSNLVFPAAGLLPILLGDLGHRGHVAARRRRACATNPRFVRRIKEFVPN